MKTITFTAKDKNTERNILAHAFTNCGASLVSMSLYTLTISLPDPSTLKGVLAETTAAHINRFLDALAAGTTSYIVKEG